MHLHLLSTPQPGGEMSWRKIILGRRGDALRLYVWMYGHIHSKNMDQPGKVVNPARGQLNREIIISLSAFAADNLVLRDGFGSPIPR